MAGMPFDTGATPSGHAVIVQTGHPALIYHKVSSTGNTHDGPYGLQRLGDVATNLPNSREDAITMAAIDAPENNNPIPQMEKNAAHPAMNSAENPSNRLKLNRFLFIDINIK